MEPAAVFNLEGNFDQSAALRLRGQLMQRGPGQMTLDFSQVGEFDDATLALLSVNLIVLQRRGRKVVLRGLRDRQIRLLDRFGVLVGPDGAVDVATEHELPFTD
jgi:anti-anti-sigma regulatory factor